MKLQESKIKNITNSSLDNYSFEIGDESLIIDFLRSKLYSDPIGSICREITCNARDAHREAGIGNKPIEITLPTVWSSILRIRDFGFGISPDRMDNIYRKYGISSKRDSNDQVGAFGIGAKSPFAYTPQFTVTSITKIKTKEDCNYFRKTSGENLKDSDIINKNIKCIYTAFISQDKKGGINLLSSSLTNEPTGVDVAIDVNRKDTITFINNIYKWTKYWDVKPIIKNSNKTYEDFNNGDELILSGSCWRLYKNYSYNNRSQIIIDGIPYPLDLSHFLNIQNIDKVLRLKIDLIINTGEVNLSINREALYYDNYTVNSLTKRLNQFLTEIIEKLNKYVESSSTYSDAYSVLAAFKKSTFNISNIDFYWRGNKIHLNGININNAKFKNLRLYKYTYNFNTGKMHKCKCHEYEIHAFPTLINDVGKFVPTSNIEKYIKDAANNKTFYVLSSITGNIEKEIKEFENNFNIKFREIAKVENLSTYKVSSKKKTVKAKNEFYAYKLYPFYSKTLVNVDDGGYYVVLNNKNEIALTQDDLKNEKYVKKLPLTSFTEINEKNVYGVKEKDLKKLNKNWILLKDYLLEQKDLLEKTCSLQEAYEAQETLNEIKKKNIYSIFNNFKLFDSTKEGLELNKEISKITKYSNNLQMLKNIYILLKIYKEPEIKLNKFILNKLSDIEDKYPMLKYIDYYYRCNNSFKEVQENIKNYIDIVNKSLENNKGKNDSI